jgi:hypothetical protein
VTLPGRRSTPAARPAPNRAALFQLAGWKTIDLDAWKTILLEVLRWPYDEFFADFLKAGALFLQPQQYAAAVGTSSFIASSAL